MNVYFNSLPPVSTPVTQPSKAISANDGWCPVIGETFSPAGAVSNDWDCDEVRQIFAQMGTVHETSKQTRHELALGAKQEVGRIQNEATERSRATQMELSALSRQGSMGGMGGGFGMGGGPMSVGSSYAASGVNTGASTTVGGSMLNSSTTAYLNDPRMDDPNYLRTMSSQQLQSMGLDPQMVQLYVNAPGQYPGGLKSMLQSNGSFYNPYSR